MGVSVDSQEDSSRLVTRLELGFPLLSDPGRSAIAAFGVNDLEQEIALPAAFVVSAENAHVLWSYIGDNPRDRPTIEQIIEVVERQTP